MISRGSNSTYDCTDRDTAFAKRFLRLKYREIQVLLVFGSYCA